METPKDEKKVAHVGEQAAEAAPKIAPKTAPGDPEWKSGLKRLYDSVLDEPLPDSFKELLAKLDEQEDK